MWLRKILDRLRWPSDERHSVDAAQLEDRVMMSASPLAGALLDSAAGNQPDGEVSVVDQVATPAQESNTAPDLGYSFE